MRGALAAVGSGLAFYLISGIWTRFDPKAIDYLYNFGCWAFLPGFLALLLERQQGTTAEQLLAELHKTLFLLQEALDRVEILAARLAKLAARSRPHYSPELRFRILEHMRQYMLSVQEAAGRFLVALYNWLDEISQDPAATTIGSTVIPVPPVRRFSDAVRRLIRQMKGVRFGGKKKIAEILLRSSWEISPRSIGRILKEKPMARSPEPQTPMPRPRPTTVRGDYPNHLWLVDITRIPTLFPMLSLHVVVVLDACSRLPLAATLRLSEPSAAVGIALLDRAIRTHGRPRHLVTDQGAQFTAGDFRAFVRSRNIFPRPHRPLLQDPQRQLEPALDPSLELPGLQAQAHRRLAQLRLPPAPHLARRLHAHRDVLRDPAPPTAPGLAATRQSR